jgi:hypothetical protein
LTALAARARRKRVWGEPLDVIEPTFALDLSG